MSFIDIVTAGGAGAHSFTRVNVNSEDNYIYFKDQDIPNDIVDGASYIYADESGSVDGVGSGNLVFASIESSQQLKFVDDQDSDIDLTGSSDGFISLNNPVIFDNILNINTSTPDTQAVRYLTLGDPITELVSGQTYFLRNVPADFSGTQALYEINNDTHTFTTAGQTGRVGPSAGQILTGYSTNWHANFLKIGDFNGYQDWTVPVSGVYELEVAGASGFEGTGSGTAGRGAIVRGKVNLTKGEIITIAVGQVGDAPSAGSLYGGSGGGTFVVRKQGSQPLFVAGGGSADANAVSGQDGRTTTRGGNGAFNRPGGSDGFGGSADGGRSAGGGGFFGRGGNSTVGEQGGGAFVDGLTANDNGGRTGGNGGFGGAGSSDRDNAGQSGGAGGFSGGAGSRATTGNRRGGAGGSFITASATNVATSDGQYEDSGTFNDVAITNLNSYNTGNGEVKVTLVESFTSGNKLYPTAQDANNDTNAIAIEPAGNSFHALVPISFDTFGDAIHVTSAHSLSSGQAIQFDLATPSPNIDPDNVYYASVIDPFSFQIIDNPPGLGSQDPVVFTVPAGRSSSDVLRRIVVNIDLDTLTIPNHGFQVDQPIQYSAGGGTPIVPLQNGVTYYVSDVIDADTIKLKVALDAPTPIDFTSAGTGTDHSFIFLTVNFSENTLYIPSHGLVSGQVVEYTTNSGDAVGGLTEGERYFVVRIDDSTIRLTSDAALQNTVNLTSTGTGTHALFIASINFDTNTITLPAHGFLQGELVEYDSRGQTEITGLTSNQTYYVIFVDGDNLRLAETPENAEANIAVNLQESPAGIGTHTLTSLTQTPDGIYTIKSIPTEDTFVVEARGVVPDLVRQFNPRTAANIDINAFFSPAHGFVTGTKLLYDAGETGTAISGLEDDTEYFVVVINQDYFRLAATQEDADSGVTLAINNFGTGVAHSFTSNQLNGAIVGSGNVSIGAGSVLVDGVGTSFSKILKVGDPLTIYPANVETVLTFADSDVNTGANRIEKAHDFETGDFIKFNTGGGVAPTPLINDYYYYVEAVDSSTIRLHTSKASAESGSSPVGLSSTGTGSAFTLTKTEPRGPIVRRITAVGSDIQVTVDRPYSDAFSEVAYSYPTFVYVRPSGFSLHRPFDGGVEMSTGAGNSFGQIIRQTRKYFRYQSGKGIQTSFAINFKPSIDLERMERFSPTTIECETRRPHGLISGLFVQIAEAEDSEGNESTIYNGEFQVTVVDLTKFRITSSVTVPEGDEARAYGYPQFHVTSWTNGAIRSGMFDFQNGMFFEFDGQDLYAVRRSSTQQTAGTVSALRGSELLFGDKTKFTAQYVEGDSIVLRGQTYKVIDIQDDTTMSVRPEYRGDTGLEIAFNPQVQVNVSENKFNITRHGLSQRTPVIYNSIDGQAIGGLINGRIYYASVVDANSFRLLATPDAQDPVTLSDTGTDTVHSFVPAKSGIIATRTVDTRVPQDEWNIDVCDGTGPSAYNLDLSRIQMCYIDYSWYGAGKIRFGFKTNDGIVRYVHEFKHNNVLFESYLRSGNLPARYEVVTFENPTYIPSLFHWGTSVIMDGTFDDDRGYLFTANSQTLSVEGTTTKSFAANSIDLDTDLITSLTHGFRTGNIVEFQSIAADGFPGRNELNPATRVVGTNTFEFLSNTERYGVLVNSPDRIHLTPPDTKFLSGATVSRSGGTITVVTNEPHGFETGYYVGVYGLEAENLVNGAFDITVTNATTFNYTVSGSETVSPVEQPGAAISEVIDFTSQGNIQYTFFIHPDGSLNNTSGPNYQPLISLRLSPSADSGLTGALGDRDVINRMQVRMQEIGISSDELVEVKLLLNGRLNNLGFTAVDPPSLVELVEHTPQDTVSGGVLIYNFQSAGGETTTQNLDTLFELSNSILGGDNIFPDGPDILTVAVSRLTGNPTRTSARLSWLEAQA